MTPYVHGYGEAARARLLGQASTLAEKLHYDTQYSTGEAILEVGCGVGGQTQFLLEQSPDALFTCIDVDPHSLSQTRERFEGNPSVSVLLEDVNQLSFQDSCFDHAFVCFVLEHLKAPKQALQELVRVIKPGGSITVIEGDHGSVLMHPESRNARKIIQCQVQLQAKYGCDAMIGRKLYPLLQVAGLQDVSVSPRLIYADASRPDLAHDFTLGTFTNMVSDIKDTIIAEALMTEVEFDKGIEGLRRAASAEGTFSYTFFKALGIVAKSEA